MARGLFVTGTDTGVGKTAVACAILRAQASAGVRAVGMKPVAAGVAGEGKYNDDVTALEVAGNVRAPITARNPYAFAPAIAPHLAARESGVAIDLATIASAYEDLASRADLVVVEGAGGALAPLDARSDMLDIAQTLGLPVVLVVGIRLGCLNHALLTALAVRARGLALAGWVANCIDPAMERRDANIATLDSRLPAPRIAVIAWGAAETPEWSAGFTLRRLLDEC